MGVLSNCEPKKVFRYFETICGIPHGSGNTDAIADYCVNFAKERGLSWYRDEANNVVIRKPGSPGHEDAPVLILQGHIDMVCEKDEDVKFDFEKDAIEPVVKGDLITAKGTTLGGDNGIAVAMMLAILDEEDLVHPPLEIFLTSDEESGMVGAFAFDCSILKGKKLINLDSEEEGVLMCSCAGGVDACSTLPVVRETVSGKTAVIEISGLTSGHSGVEIDKGRANANVLMARALYGLCKEFPLQIKALSGGSRETAIASSARAELLLPASEEDKFLERAAHYQQIFAKEYASAEPNFVMNVSCGAEITASVLTCESTKKVCHVLQALPDSVQSMSIDMPGLVQTSTNFGILKLDEEELHFVNDIRSSITSQKKAVFAQIEAITSLAGGRTREEGDYPGWSYNPNSKLMHVIADAYERISGKKASIEAVHAGIECGLFADSIEGLDCVSIGPDMGDVHTPKEYLSISSSKRTYELLKKVLEESV